MTAVLEVDRLTKHFAFRRGLFRGEGAVRAVDGVTFSLAQGETLALVGESGCGKSTVARLVLRLTDPTSGTIRLNGEDVTHMAGESLRRARRNVQLVFQDPFASLNPRMTARQIVAEPLINYGAADDAAFGRRIEALFDSVGLARHQWDRFPHEFSGGQRQRLGIARALALNPAVLVADEPVAALDVSIQAQILNLLADLKRDLGLAYLFISHDLSVVEFISTTVAVMYLGTIVEIASRDAFFKNPRHPYARALLELRSGHPSEPARPARIVAGRDSERQRAAVRVPVSNAVSDGDGDLCRAATAARGESQRSSGGLPPCRPTDVRTSLSMKTTNRMRGEKPQ